MSRENLSAGYGLSSDAHYSCRKEIAVYLGGIPDRDRS